MFDLKDLIIKAFKTLQKQSNVDIDDLEIEMLFNDNEPVFKCSNDGELILNTNNKEVFSLKELIGFLKYNMLFNMAQAFGGLNNIVNSKVKAESEKYKFKFEDISLLFYYDEVMHDDFRVITKDGEEKYLKFSEFIN